jgi:hypothetical protein
VLSLRLFGEEAGPRSPERGGGEKGFILSGKLHRVRRQT